MGSRTIVYKKYISIGVAVDTERGLLVPVIRDVDKKDITQISVELTDISSRAREKKLSADRLRGGTFTITNLGGIGGTFFTPILNPPEVAILGVSRSSVEPAYVDGEFMPKAHASAFSFLRSQDYRRGGGGEVPQVALRDARELSRECIRAGGVGGYGENNNGSGGDRSGPGGISRGVCTLADKGKKVTLIDPEANPGGVCLYRGCIPSKALLHAARVAEEARDAADFGLSYGEPRVDPGKLFSWKDRVVAKLTGGLRSLVRGRKINYVRGRASFTSSGALCVVTNSGEEQEVVFQNAVIATGSVSRRIPGLDFGSRNVVDSDGALSMGEIPKTLLVVGGGYIGLELGTFFSSLGTEVTVVEMLPGLLQGVDRDLAGVLKKRLDGKFRSIMLETKLASLSELGNEVQVLFEADGKSFRENMKRF